MMISIIAAMADNRVIGINNSLPWKLPADMSWFRKHTLGKPVLMGRTTFDSIGKPLPNRTNLILSRDPACQIEGTQVYKDFASAQMAVQDEPELMVIGGSTIYQQLLPQADRLYLTFIHHEFAGDSWFPAFYMADWRELERTDCEPDEKNPYRYSFVILERIKPVRG